MLDPKPRMARQSLNQLFNPQSISLVGASSNPGKAGYLILENLKKYFQGKVFPVNPKLNEVLGLRAYSSVADVPDEVDLAIVAVPARMTPQVVQECGTKGIKFALVISGGFAEFGDEGNRLSAALLKTAKAGSVRIIGPNSLGVVCSSAGLCASFSPEFKREGGDYSCISQSGGIWRIIFSRAEELGTGIEKYVGSGNEIDLNASDYLSYLSDDPKTKVILLYIEGLKYPRKFLQLARRVSRKKPILAVKAGKSFDGSRTVLSHTASISGREDLYRTFFKQYGIVEVNDPADLVDYAGLFRAMPRGKISRGVAILSAGGGLSILTADTFRKAGLKVPRFSIQTIREISARLELVSIVENPLDLGMTPVDERGFRNLAYFGRLALSEDDVGFLVLVNNVDIFLPEEVISSARLLQQEFPSKKVITIWHATNYDELRKSIARMGREGICAFTSSATAASSVSSYVDYLEWRIEGRKA